MLKYVSPNIIWARANTINDIPKTNCILTTNLRAMHICVVCADRNYYQKPHRVKLEGDGKLRGYGQV